MSITLKPGKHRYAILEHMDTAAFARAMENIGIMQDSVVDQVLGGNPHTGHPQAPKVTREKVARRPLPRAEVDEILGALAWYADHLVEDGTVDIQSGYVLEHVKSTVASFTWEDAAQNPGRILDVALWLVLTCAAIQMEQRMVVASQMEGATLN